MQSIQICRCYMKLFEFKWYLKVFSHIFLRKYIVVNSFHTLFDSFRIQNTSVKKKK